MKIQDIQINKIKITDNHRVNIEKTNLDELMQSIKQHGLIQPIGIAPNGKGRYKLRVGQRRLLACQKLGYKTVSAMVSGDIKEEKLLLENITENIQRTDPSFGEIGRIIHKLENNGLSLKQISVRIGITYKKVKQIYDVYSEFPEKYRKRVSFLSPGAGRKKIKGGAVPAQVATKIINLKRHHSLSDKDVGSIFDSVSEKGLDFSDLNNVGNLVAGGMTIEQSLERMRDYGTFQFEIIAEHKYISMLLQKHGVINKRNLFKKIIYGELPPLVKPDWVSTGIIVKKEKSKIVNKTKFRKMRSKLIELKKKGKLNESQILALKTTEKLHLPEWSDEQCNQIECMYEDIKTDGQVQ